jgi:hypothetical protein
MCSKTMPQNMHPYSFVYTRFVFCIRKYLLNRSGWVGT